MNEFQVWEKEVEERNKNLKPGLFAESVQVEAVEDENQSE